jgi:RNA polymerase sigma-70 factor (ECF subfamily)
MQPTDSFAILMERLRAGDSGAARRIFHEYSQRLVGLARTRMDRRVLQKEDPAEVVHSALASFFRRCAAGQFELADREGLWALLTLITLRKCGHHVRHYRAACRDVRREATQPETEESSDSWQALAREPSPAEAAALADVLHEVLRGLDEDDRQIVLLTLDGHAVAEVSRRVDRSEYMVRKVLKRVRERWDRLSE